jgi:hypothetical protein
MPFDVVTDYGIVFRGALCLLRILVPLGAPALVCSPSSSPDRRVVGAVQPARPGADAGLSAGSASELAQIIGHRWPTPFDQRDGRYTLM